MLSGPRPLPQGETKLRHDGRGAHSSYVAQFATSQYCSNELPSCFSSYLKHTDLSVGSNEFPGIGFNGVSLGLALVNRFE